MLLGCAMLPRPVLLPPPFPCAAGPAGCHLDGAWQVLPVFTQRTPLRGRSGRLPVSTAVAPGHRLGVVWDAEGRGAHRGRPVDGGRGQPGPGLGVLTAGTGRHTACGLRVAFVIDLGHLLQHNLLHRKAGHSYGPRSNLPGGPREQPLGQRPAADPRAGLVYPALHECSCAPTVTSVSLTGSAAHDVSLSLKYYW